MTNGHNERWKLWDSSCALFFWMSAIACVHDKSAVWLLLWVYDISAVWPILWLYDMPAMWPKLWLYDMPAVWPILWLYDMPAVWPKLWLYDMPAVWPMLWVHDMSTVWPILWIYDMSVMWHILWVYYMPAVWPILWAGLNNSIGPIARNCPEWPSGTVFVGRSCPPNLYLENSGNKCYTPCAFFLFWEVICKVTVKFNQFLFMISMISSPLYSVWLCDQLGIAPWFELSMTKCK